MIFESGVMIISYQYIYLIIISVLGLVGILIFWNFNIREARHKLRIKKNRYDKFVDYVKKATDEKEINRLFHKSGLRINANQYQFFRYTIFGIWFILQHLLFLITNETYPSKQVIILSILFVLTSPKKSFMGKRTPFKYVIDLVIKDYKNKKNIEVYRMITQLKNIAIARQNDPPGSDFILEQIRKFTKTTRTIFNRTIALWTMGRKEEACNYFGKAIDTKEAIELASLLRKLDDLNPIELKKHLILLQENVKKERETKKLQANENKSNFIYFIVAITGIIIMVNFVVVVYYIESINQLRFLY